MSVKKSSYRYCVSATEYIVAIAAVVGTYRSLFLPHIQNMYIHLLSVSRVLQYYVSAPL